MKTELPPISDPVFKWIQKGPYPGFKGLIDLLVVDTLLDFGMYAAFSTRRGGVSKNPFTSLNLDERSGDDRIAVEMNLQLLRQALDLPIDSDLNQLDQRHGTTIIPMSALSDELCAGDGVSLDDSGAVVLRFADCVPIALADTARRLLVTIHAGWRGLAQGMHLLAVSSLIDDGSRKQDIEVFFGPAIRGCCYEIGIDVLEALGVSAAKPSKFDLVSYTKLRLGEAGILRNNLHDPGLCTCCHPEFFYSYRRDGEKTGRQASIAAIL